jgi:predicted KAP-like P-loop ATPase
MVLGIAGSWGSGKTSLLNLVEHHLKELRRKQTDRSLVIIRFNPWNYSTIEQLISMFFRELRVGLNAVDNVEVVTQIGNALQKLAVLLTPLAAVPGLQAAGLVSSILSPVGSLLKHAAGNRSLETVKRDLNGYLREAGIHLVLIVDDLDRLEPDCVALMLRLLRMNADFDNTTYVLGFDPIRTAKLLRDHYGSSMAYGYMDKIIQVPFDLPVLDPVYVKIELLKALKPVLSPLGDNAELDARWDDIKAAGFFDLFQTLRDVKRFVNSVSVTLPLIWGKVNPIDFLAVEAIRLFCSELYFELHTHKDILLDSRSDLTEEAAEFLGVREHDAALDKSAFETFLKKAGSKEGTVRRLLATLFPRLSRFSDESGRHSGRIDLEWSCQCRICSMSHFDTYFMLTVPLGCISEEQLHAALSLVDDRDEFAAMLLSLEYSGQAEQLLSRFSTHIDELSPSKIKNTIGALLDVGDELSGKGVPDPDPSFATRIAFYLASLTRSIEDADTRQKMLCQSLKSGKGIYSVTRLAVMLDGITFEGRPVLSEDAIRDLRWVAVQRIRNAAESGELLKAPWPVFILFRWKEWEKEQNRPKCFIEEAIKTDAGLLRVVNAFVRSVYSYTLGARNVEITHEFPLDALKEFLVPEELAEKAKTILDSGQLLEASELRELTSREQDLLRGFVNSVDGKKGQP